MRIGEKVVVFTDIHLGLRANERRHNGECEQFIKWMIQEAQEFGAKKCIFMGDWHHRRDSVQTSTLNYSNSCFEFLSRGFDHFYTIVGNHDLFFKDKREIHSIDFARNFNNISIINDITPLGDVVLSPWLVGDETKTISKFTQPYVFGHFEFPHFMMNAMVAMPDTGHINAEQFKVKEQSIFSGHFHKRQSQVNSHGANIIYMGNCFPHSFSDAGDDDRGIMLLELGKPPIYKSWPAAPKYRVMNLSILIENPETQLDQFTAARVNIDLDISYEESNYIRDTLATQFQVRDLKLLPNKNAVVSALEGADISKFDTVDAIVLEQLGSIESATLDKAVLIDIYNNI